jgi:hypothetical protein
VLVIRCDRRAGFVSADVNGDGLSDILYINAAGNLITALGRGKGTFSITNQAPATANEFLLAGGSTWQRGPSSGPGVTRPLA